MKKLIIPIIVLLVSLNAFGQRGDKMRDRIKAQKVAFITDRLDLSAEEAQKFWPIYNAFEEMTESVRQNDLREVREAMRRGNLSDSEAQKVLDQFMAVEDKLHEAKKQLVKDLGNAIPPQKIIALKAAEDAFNQRIIRMLQQQKEKMQNRKN